MNAENKCIHIKKLLIILVHCPQIEDLLENFGGLNWIDREVHGTLVATSKVVQTNSLRYMKVHFT